jgi:hypothetical protein
MIGSIINCDFTLTERDAGPVKGCGIQRIVTLGAEHAMSAGQSNPPQVQRHRKVGIW